jgi:hypothetical protein
VRNHIFRNLWILSVLNKEINYICILYICVCVPNRNFRDFKIFHVDLNCRNCPSARCTSVANAISRILVYSMVSLFWLMTCYQCKYWIRRCSSVTATFLNQVIYVLSGIGFLPQYFFYIVLLHICFCFVSLVFCLVYLKCFVFYLCLCAGFVIGTCAVKPAR